VFNYRFAAGFYLAEEGLAEFGKVKGVLRSEVQHLADIGAYGK
jgi:hypothetical protein